MRRAIGQILTGIAFMHSHGVVHLDLKLPNIFVDTGFGS
ncbi:protein kinase domain-containing protein, partial [Algiphilus sp.]